MGRTRPTAVAVPSGDVVVVTTVAAPPPVGATMKKTVSDSMGRPSATVSVAAAVHCAPYATLIVRVASRSVVPAFWIVYAAWAFGAGRSVSSPSKDAMS